jgi:hypothetical protein
MTAPSKTYRARRVADPRGGTKVVCTVEIHGGAEDGRTYPLRHRQRHSPDGFEMGYGGGGPAELARSIMWDHLGQEPHPACYQDFKWAVVAAADRNRNTGLDITSETIDAWIESWRRQGDGLRFATRRDSDAYLSAPPVPNTPEEA